MLNPHQIEDVQKQIAHWTKMQATIAHVSGDECYHCSIRDYLAELRQILETGEFPDELAEIVENEGEK